MREIAKRLGVTQTAPRHHFPNKSALLAAIAAQGFRMPFDQRMAALKDRRTSAERLMAALMTYVEFALAHPALYQLMHGPEIPESADSFYRDRVEAIEVDSEGSGQQHEHT